MERKNHWKIVFFVFIFGFVLRIGFAFYLENRFYFDDEYEYWKMVENFISGKGLMVAESLKAYRPPLYPLFLAILVKMGSGIIGIRISQAFISALTCVFIYFLGKEIFDKKVAIMSSFLSSFYPFFIFYSGFLLTETLFIFLVVLSIYTFIKLFQPETLPFYGLATGAVTAFSGLCRPTMELFFPFCLIFVMLAKDNSLQKRIKKVLFACTGFVLVLTPWIVRNYIVLGKFIPGTTMGGGVFWEGNNPCSEGGPCRYFPEEIAKLPEIERDKAYYKKTIEIIKENPARFLWLLQNKFKRFWNIVPNASEFTKPLYRIISILSFGVMLPFFVLGFLITLKNKKVHLIHFLFIFFTLFHVIYLASIRYRVPLEPFYIMLASYCFFWLMDKTFIIIKQ